MIKRLTDFLTFQNVFQMIHIGSVSDPDPGSVGSIIFSRIRIRVQESVRNCSFSSKILTNAKLKMLKGAFHWGTLRVGGGSRSQFSTDWGSFLHTTLFLPIFFEYAIAVSIRPRFDLHLTSMTSKIINAF